jgi:hypothetical protein
MESGAEIEKQVIEDFSSAVKTLVQDASRLRQIASLYRICSNSSSNAKPSYQSLVSQLIQMDQTITSLEDKVSTLTFMIKEEEDQVQVMKRLYIAAMDQNKVIHQVMAGCQSIGISFPSDKDTKETVSTCTQHEDDGYSHWNRERRVKSTLDLQLSSLSLVHLTPISESELDSVSRNIRGRLSLILLNEALGEIHRAVQRKYEILKGPGKQYKETLQRHRELESEEHEGFPWISEQELRRSCAFFRGGESTARSILLVLRTLKRLKQVFGKGHEVTYIVVY